MYMDAIKKKTKRSATAAVPLVVEKRKNTVMICEFESFFYIDSLMIETCSEYTLKL
jgi:hypothetical protein